ncbi:MAG: hypothetical protein PHU25_03060 [Deltaproteobacteria bacterium]|nr:hypothetical protein [Deltaproteobacteria bacterium]
MRKIVLPVAFVFALLAGCAQKTEPPPATQPKAAAALPKASAVAPKVERIVFVGQKNACDCTRARIDKMWARLESVLASGPRVPVERIDLDVDEKRYNDLDALRSLVVPPGIYFLDGLGAVVELLQGEVEESRIAGSLR